MDYINEIVHPDGKLSGKGYSDFILKNNTLEKVRNAIEYARENQIQIIFVKVGFSSDYKELPRDSLLFGKAEKFGALKLDTWATEFHKELDVRESDHIVVKHRISPFSQESLDNYLKNNKITDLYLCGVATDLVVESSARDAHDRDHNIYVLSDCCAAASNEDHENSLKTMRKFANVGTSEELLK